MGDVTMLLGRLQRGEEAAAGELFGLLYGELRGLAGAIFRSQKPSHTLQPTAVVHEAYLKMLGSAAPGDRTHFFAVAAKAMRQILVNHARDRNALKRGGGRGRVTMSDLAGADRDVLAVHDALEALSKLDERQGRIAELRFFAGLTVPEIAGLLDVSPRTVELDWKMAKDWLAQRL